LQLHSHDELANCPLQVRRAAAKVLAAAALACTDSTGGVYGRTAGDLVARFKEREENVRADVFAAFVTLARQVRLGNPCVCVQPAATVCRN
jgi:cullin-associated NEDD8-dissociated protein 1